MFAENSCTKTCYIRRRSEMVTYLLLYLGCIKEWMADEERWWNRDSFKVALCIVDDERDIVI